MVYYDNSYFNLNSFKLYFYSSSVNSSKIKLYKKLFLSLILGTYYYYFYIYKKL